MRFSLRQQIFLLFLTLASFPFLYYQLQLPKIITNKAIKPKYVPQTYFGIQFDQIHYLLVLCVAFLVVVLINGGFKYFMNTYKGRLGERMLRRFRYQLYQRMLLFPLSYFNKNSSAQIIPMITAECESLGGFVGDAVATPAFQGGTLLTNILFMFMQDPVLGLAAVALYPVQGYVIPKLQRKVNQLNRRRVRTVRQVADRVQESATGIDRHSRQRRDQASADWFRSSARHDLRHPLRDLSAQILCQIPKQLHGAADAVFLLFDRRLPGDPRQSVGGLAGGGADRPEGARRAVE